MRGKGTFHLSIAAIYDCVMLNRRLVASAAVACAVVVCVSCAGGGVGRGFTRQYEYEEDVTLDLDGSAEITVNASIAALVALHGLSLPIDPRARLDRNEVRRAFESPVTYVTRVSRPWRRKGRRYIQVRLAVRDIRQLSKAGPFSWAQYQLTRTDGRATFTERVAGSRREPAPEAGWDGSELVAFKLHLPSRIFFHNVRDLDTKQTGSVERGNILRWEQRLTDRLAGVPIDMEVRMDNQSILHRTLWLFAGAFAAAMAVLIGLIWWTVRRGRQRQAVDAVPPHV
jgi:hypothetical protein